MLEEGQGALAEDLAALQTHEGDVARREEQVALQEVDATTHEVSLAQRE